MARRRSSTTQEWEQRKEIHYLLDWCNKPAKNPLDYMAKRAVFNFLHGKDPSEEFEKMGLPRFQYIRGIETARVIIGNERAARRSKAAEILANRVQTPSFTSGNLRVTIDHSNNRNVGSMSVSIYCVVEVWQEEDLEKDYLVCYSDISTKEWLTKTLVWALTNDREILIKPASQEDMNNMRMFVPKDKTLEREVS